MSTITDSATATDEAEVDKTDPTPGSPAALNAGCLCPVWLNSYGDGLRTEVGTPLETGQYLRHPSCRLHGTL